MSEVLDLDGARGESEARAWVRRLEEFDPIVLVDTLEELIAGRGDARWVESVEARNAGERHELAEALAMFRWRVDELPGSKLRRHLTDLFAASLEARIEKYAVDEHIPNVRRAWQCGIPKLDQLTGGLYGMCVIAGQPKLGKSLLSVSSAAQAAHDGWRVVYVNAELTEGDLIKRFSVYCRAADLDIGRVAEMTSILSVLPGINTATLLESIAEEITLEDSQVMIVMDSINRVADFCIDGDGEAAYWRALRDLSTAAMISRRLSEGRVAWTIISELAAAGHVKGRTLEYVADVVVRMTASNTPDFVEIDVPFSRQTKSGRCGGFFRDFETGQFVDSEVMLESLES